MPVVMVEDSLARDVVRITAFLGDRKITREPARHDEPGVILAAIDEVMEAIRRPGGDDG